MTTPFDTQAAIVRLTADLDEEQIVEAPPPTRSGWQRIGDLALEYGIVVALVGEIILFTILSDYFWGMNNFINIAQASAVTGIVAAAFCLMLIGGRIDLSVASIVALTTVVLARTVAAGAPFVVGLLAALGAALAVGVLNAVVSVTFGVNALVTSLAAMTFVGGLALVISEGGTKSIVAPGFQDFIFSRPLGIPTPVWILACVFIGVTLLLYRTRLGWHIYAVGGNPLAAERAAISTRKVYWFLYLLAAFLAFVAGVVTAGRSGAGSAALGPDVFNVMTAVLLGGAIGFTGGAGRIERTLIGVLFISVMENGLILLKVPSFYADLIRGTALVLAVVLGSIRDRRMMR
jgi:ribose transport system permease protein